MYLAAEAELTGLFITDKAMLPIRKTLIEMGWPQPKTPIQTYNSTAEGVTNNTIVQRQLKYMDVQLWWLHFHAAQDQFRFSGDQANPTRATTAPNIIRLCITYPGKVVIHNARRLPSPFIFISFLVQIL